MTILIIASLSSLKLRLWRTLRLVSNKQIFICYVNIFCSDFDFFYSRVRAGMWHLVGLSQQSLWFLLELSSICHLLVSSLHLSMKIDSCPETDIVFEFEYYFVQSLLMKCIYDDVCYLHSALFCAYLVCIRIRFTLHFI